MRFIKLEIKNLASLDREEGEVINFEEGALKDSNIFSIVGPTGSGKSTILDAICLALYGRAPRYPRERGQRQKIEIYGNLEEGEKNRLAPTDCRNILSRGKKIGYSKLTFVANNGDVFRAEWHVEFKEKKYTEISKNPPRLYKITEKDGTLVEEQAKWDDLPEIIGLDYEQFLRTVLISQGAFAEFLKADADERYKLLEKLVDSEGRYKVIAAKIKTQKDSAIEKFNTLNAGYSAFENDIIPDEELETLCEKIKDLEEESQKAKEELGQITVALKWFIDENQYLRNIAQYQKDKSIAEEALEGAKADIDRLSLHDDTILAITLYKEIQDTEGRIIKQKEELEKINKSIEKKSSEIQQSGQDLKGLKQVEADAIKALEEQRPHINKARTIKGELEAASSLVKEKDAAKTQSENDYKKAKDAVDKNAEDIKQCTNKLNEANQEFTNLQASIDTEKKQLAAKVEQATAAFNEECKKIEGVDANKLQTAKSDAEQKRNDLKDAIRIQTELGKKHQSLQENAGLRITLKKREEEIVNELRGFKIDALSAELDTLRRTHTLMTSEDWALHRSHLEKGKACPLCGATEHPYQSVETLAPVVYKLLALINEKDKTLESQRTRKELLDKEQGEIGGKLQSINESDTSLNKEIGTLQTEWAVVHQKHPEWTEDVAALETMQSDVIKAVDIALQTLNSYNATVKKINELRGEKETCEKKQRDYDTKSANDLDAAKNKINAANTQLETEKGKTENLLSQRSDKEQAMNKALAALNEAISIVEEKKKMLMNEIGDKDPDAFEQELTNAKNEATKNVNDKVEALGKLREELQSLNGQQTTTQNNISTENQKLNDSKQSLNQWLMTYNGNHERQLTKEDVAALYSASDNWEEIRKRRDQLKNNVTERTTTYNNEVRSHDEHKKNKPSQSQEELTARKAELEQKSDQELTDAKARLQRHDDAKRKTGELFDQRQAAESLKNDWEKISNAIGSDGDTLRKIAQCYTLRFLIEHANAEIRKFNTRYELQQVKNSLGIRVIDHDRADDVRDTTSLSGGETFIVSLGLALGLSSLSSRNISFENLFIDEGFGTLDPDTLATVIDSLAMLQSSQGKKVGVISHTDTMSERITTQIRIIKNGHSGSSHIEIYPKSI